jgi:hypothetical protein
LLTRDQEHWGVAYSAFILAKQAGFDLTFRYAGQPLPDAPIYLMPCLKGLEILYRRHWPALLERVAAGATLYLSLDDALPSGFEALTGLRPTARERRAGYAAVALDGIPGHPVISCAGGYRLNPTPVGAKVLASEPEGAPLLTEYRYGQGRVIFLGVSLEMTLTTTPGVFHGANASAAWQLYCYIADGAMQGRAVRKEEPLLALTEHPVSETERIVVAVNQSPGQLKARVRLVDGWRLAECLHGEARVEGREILFDLLACDGSVLRVETKEAQA